MFLLDTNVVSELRRIAKGQGNRGVESWAASVSNDILYLSVMSVYEIEKGIQSLSRRDRIQASMLRHWLDATIMPNHRDRLLPVTEQIARQAAIMQFPDPRPWADTLIAATAIVHGLTVVTRNTANFRSCSSFNPFA